MTNSGLQRLLEDRFPRYLSARGGLDTPRLAKKIGVSHETMYRAYRSGKLAVRLAKNLVALNADERVEADIFGETMPPVLSIEDLLPFVLK